MKSSDIIVSLTPKNLTMLKGIYIACALVTYAPFLFFHGLVSLMIWNAGPWDDACQVITEMIDSVTNNDK